MFELGTKHIAKMMMEGSPPTQIPPSSFLYRLDKLAYSTPPPVSNDPANNAYRIIDYRGAKIASFNINGEVMICLPQAFELFLKHLVGGLHTVYTKLKRLNITPVVCNVEQVRVLRSIGAIQPGVNRCKLLTRKQFDVLYEDCTTASSRPGRPPKRTMPLSLTPTIHGLPSHHPLEALKRHKIENGLPFGYEGLHASPYILAHHPAFMHSSLAMTSPHLPALTPSNDMAEGSGSDGEQHSLSPPPVSTHYNHTRNNGKCSPTASEHSVNASLKSNGISSDDEMHGKENMDRDNLSGNEDIEASDTGRSVGGHNGSVSSHSSSYSPTMTTVHSSYQTNASHNQSSLHQSLPSDLLVSPAPSSMETLLTNIQGLLKVAADNARQQEKQNNLERAELKLEMLREKELRESLEKQLAAEQRRTAILLKRLKKEKKAKRKLQELNGSVTSETSQPLENGDQVDVVKKYKMESIRSSTETFHEERQSPNHMSQSETSNQERSQLSPTMKSQVSTTHKPQLSPTIKPQLSPQIKPDRNTVPSIMSFNGQH